MRSGFVDSRLRIEPIDLDDEGAILQDGSTPQRRVTLVGVHHEQFATRLILPAEPEVRAQRVVAGVELHQPTKEHPRRERVRGPGGYQLRGKATLREVDPVDRDARLDGQLRRDLDTTAGVACRRDVAVKELTSLDGKDSGDPALRPHCVRHVDVLKIVRADRNGDVGGDLERVH